MAEHALVGCRDPGPRRDVDHSQVISVAFMLLGQKQTEGQLEAADIIVAVSSWSYTLVVLMHPG